MQYVKLGPVKIPYQICGRGEKKTLQVGIFRIPFSSYEKNNRKIFKICGVPLRLPNHETWVISQKRANYLEKDRMTREQLENVACEIFREKLGYPLNLQNPQTFNEKIFWLKLNYHDPLITKCCDKFRVKDYVNEVLGPGYVLPTLASWERAEDIDFDTLPQQYVLKVNWSSGFNIIVRDKAEERPEEFREKVHHWMQPQQNSYYQTFNWGYKDMQPVVYAETYMEQVDGQLYDYKFFCCNGKMKFMFIATDRYQGEKARLTHDFFDADFQPLPFYYGGRGHAAQPLEKPEQFDEMVRLAESLSKPFPFVRVDFYQVAGKLYVGEMTFYPGGGVLAFDPPEWDRKLGEWISLPDRKE